MDVSTKPRRASAKACLKAINKYARSDSSDDSSFSEELESEESDYEPKVVSEKSETSDSFNSENDGSIESLSTPSSCTNSSSNDQIETRQKMLDLEKLMRRPLHTFLADNKQSSNAKSALLSFFRMSRKYSIYNPVSTTIRKFEESIRRLRTTMFDTLHPFLSCPISPFLARQNALFYIKETLDNVSTPPILDHFPNPAISPQYNSNLDDDSTCFRLKRFEFDSESKLLYVGGRVTCLAWCPPRLRSLVTWKRLHQENSFLALSALSQPDSCTYYDSTGNNECGTIQIWNCGVLRLTERASLLRPQLHFLIDHDWGRVTDMTWLPISPLTGYTILQTRLPKGLVHLTPDHLIDQILGHLVVACQSGVVRIFGIPVRTSNLAFNQHDERCRNVDLLVAHTYVPKNMLHLSATLEMNPRWLGWPVCIHIRSQFPDRLLVGYTSGYVAYFNLSVLNPMVFNSKDLHLTPVKLFRVINGPVVSIALHPVNGHVIIVQGIDRQIGCWDLDDPVCCTPASPDLQWSTFRGVFCNDLVWPADSEFVTTTRQNAFAIRHSTTKKSRQLRSACWNWSRLIDSYDNAVCQLIPSCPPDSCRYLVPLGIQSCTSLDFSEYLNTLACSTDRGRIEIVLHSQERRTASSSKMRYIPQMRLPLLQWTLQMNSSKIFDDLVDNIYPNQTCDECQLDIRSHGDNVESDETGFCWHKLWVQGQLSILSSRDEVSKRPFADWIQTPYLRINKVRFNVNPFGATWLASCNDLGFVHFACVDQQTYNKKLDDVLNAHCHIDRSKPPTNAKTTGSRKTPHKQTTSDRRRKRPGVRRVVKDDNNVSCQLQSMKLNDDAVDGGEPCLPKRTVSQSTASTESCRED